MSPQLIAALALGGAGAVGGAIGQSQKNKYYEDYARALDAYSKGLGTKGIEDQNALIQAFRARADQGGIRAGMQGQQAMTDMGGQANQALAGGTLSNVVRSGAQAGQQIASETAAGQGSEVTGNLSASTRLSMEQEAYKRRIQALKDQAAMEAKSQRGKKKKWWKSALEGAASGAMASIGLGK